MANNKEEQSRLFSEPSPKYALTPEEQARKEEYQERLRECVKDPEFRKTEGFPIGDDDSVLALSDPPYYTACPNPFAPEIIQDWQNERKTIRDALGIEEKEYHREPFTSDVSEGKNEPIYNAISYHTKVPYKALMHYLLHYSDPGDIVLDGFCGSGMTGVAAQMCQSKPAVESLGYRVNEKGQVISSNGVKKSHIGKRRAFLTELSPAASLIAYSINNIKNTADIATFKSLFVKVISDVEKEYGWMYKTWFPNFQQQGKSQKNAARFIWSDLFRCPNCGFEIVFWDVAVDKHDKKVLDTWGCPNCKTILSKSPTRDSGAITAERVKETIFDPVLNMSLRQPKQTLAFIQYKKGNKLIEKDPDNWDIELLDKIQAIGFPNWIPQDPIMRIGEKWGDTWRAGVHSGITHSHHFYTRRNLIILSRIYEQAQLTFSNHLQFHPLWKAVFQSASVTLCSKLSRYNLGKRGNGPVSGTLYVASLVSEENVFDKMSRKLTDLCRGLGTLDSNRSINLISTSSSTNLNLLNNESPEKRVIEIREY